MEDIDFTPQEREEVARSLMSIEQKLAKENRVMHFSLVMAVFDAKNRDRPPCIGQFGNITSVEGVVSFLELFLETNREQAPSVNQTFSREELTNRGN